MYFITIQIYSPYTQGYRPHDISSHIHAHGNNFPYGTHFHSAGYTVDAANLTEDRTSNLKMYFQNRKIT